jgi:hypothetical protein
MYKLKYQNKKCLNKTKYIDDYFSHNCKYCLNLSSKASLLSTPTIKQTTKDFYFFYITQILNTMKRKGHELKEIYHPLAASREGGGTYLGMTQSSKVLKRRQIHKQNLKNNPQKKKKKTNLNS